MDNTGTKLALHHTVRQGTAAGIPVGDEELEDNMTRTQHTTLGDLIALFYEEFLQLYGDEELASVAAAAVINDMLSAPVEEEALEDAA